MFEQVLNWFSSIQFLETIYARQGRLLCLWRNYHNSIICSIRRSQYPCYLLPHFPLLHFLLPHFQPPPPEDNTIVANTCGYGTLRLAAYSFKSLFTFQSSVRLFLCCRIAQRKRRCHSAAISCDTAVTRHSFSGGEGRFTMRAPFFVDLGDIFVDLGDILTNRRTFRRREIRRGDERGESISWHRQGALLNFFTTFKLSKQDF